MTLYPSARGLSTGRIPLGSDGFQIDYDMIDHEVLVTKNDGRIERFLVTDKSVADFHAALFLALSSLGIDVEIKGEPYENVSTIPFAIDHTHKTYDRGAVSAYWQALCSIASIFEIYRGGFCGKQTPVHLYWHSFDLVSTRFSGRAAPLENPRTQSDREAYSHEVISVGFWPGDDTFQEAAFYGYAYPEPDSMNTIPLAPTEAFWTDKNGGALAVLRYEDMRTAKDPEQALLLFLNSVYEGAAEKSGWDTRELAHMFKDQTGA